MFAVVKTGGKQYRVAKDDVIVVEKLAGEPGATVELDQVLMLDDGKGLAIGAPLIDGARVAATVIDQARSDKIIVFKKKRRKKYRRTHGHRQDITVLRITDILATGKKAAATAKASADADGPAAGEAAPAAKPTAKTTAEAPAKPAAKKKAAAKPPAAKPKAAAPAKKAAAKSTTAAKPKSSGAAKKPAAKRGAGTSKRKS